VRELEQKLNDLEQTSTDLHADNERLKRELARIATENEILRATGSKQNGNNNDNGDSHEINDHHHNRHHSDNHTTTGPLKFSPIDVQKSIADSSKDGNLPHRIVISDKTGERLLNARATWDMIQDHSMFKQGLVDIGDVCSRLKGFEKCDGQGPVFEEGCVRKAIEESVGCGNDELI
jgi:AP-1-like factor